MTTSPITERTTIDCDVHLDVGKSEIAKYADEPYRNYNTEYTRAGNSQWDVSMHGKIDRDERRLHTAKDVNEKLCIKFDVDYPIINTFPRLSACPQTDLAVNLMKAHNDLLIEQFLDHYDHFYGLATITQQDPNKAAEEIERIQDEDKIVGIFLNPAGAFPPLGDPKYDEIYAAAENYDLPVAYHTAASSMFRYEFPHDNYHFETFISIHALSHLWSMTKTITSLIVQGVPEKFSNLNFIMLEAGISWIPYIMFRLNREYSMRRSEAPLLEKSPEEYLRSQFYFGSQPLDEPNYTRHMGQIIDMVGTDNLLFATDFPHWDFDDPASIARELNKHSGDDLDKIFFENASELFGMKV